MKQITDTAATEALERTDYRCGLVSLTRGRCAGNQERGLPLHHIKYRSHGGGHETENLLPLCASHHDEIHDRGKALCTDSRGRRYYQLWNTETLERMYLWEDLKDELWVKADTLDASFQSHFRQETIARIEMARDLAEMDRFALFPLLNGEPETAQEYCQTQGIAPPTVRGLIAAGRFLLDAPDEYKRLTTYNERCETGCEFTYTMLRDAVGSLNRKDAHEQGVAVTEMMVLRSEGMPGSVCVDTVRGVFPEKQTWEITATFTVSDAALTLLLDAQDKKGAVKAFERLTGLSGVLDGILTVSSLNIRKGGSND